jgi:LPXTG-motif cell wall-anchored protein
MRKGYAVTVLVGLLISGGTASVMLTSPASAADPECRTVVTSVTNRPDNGDHGPWAVDTFTRTVKICKVEPPAPAAEAAKTVPVQAWDYEAKYVDAGSFVTKGGATLSPNAGVALTAGVKGTFEGYQSITFTAPANWLGFSPKATVDGATPSSQDWVKAMWQDGYTNHKPGKEWKYAYKTCNDTWTEASSGGSGDITGSKPCPSASASASASPSPPVPTSTQPVGNALPVTGSKTGLLISVGLVLLLVGGGLVFATRRREVRHE